MRSATARHTAQLQRRDHTAPRDSARRATQQSGVAPWLAFAKDSWGSEARYNLMAYSMTYINFFIHCAGNITLIICEHFQCMREVLVGAVWHLRATPKTT